MRMFCGSCEGACRFFAGALLFIGFETVDQFGHMRKLRGQTAILTGASGGLGNFIAPAMARAGIEPCSGGLSWRGTS